MSGHLDKERLANPRRRVLVLKRDAYRCRYCGAQVTKQTAHIDHVTPWVRTGRTVIANLVTACAFCNQQKGVNMEVEPSPIGGPYIDPFHSKELPESPIAIIEAHRMDREMRQMFSTG